MNKLIKTAICLFLFFVMIILPYTLFGSEFEVGEKYHILQYKADIRKEPARNSNVIAILSLNDEIEILEKTMYGESINDVYGFWYKIRYGTIIGYTFGGNIAKGTLITDIDKNGVNDYFYYRFSVYHEAKNQTWWEIDSYVDIIIFINNERINIGFLDQYWYNMPRDDYLRKTSEHKFYGCEFKEKDDHVLIELQDWGRDTPVWSTVYKVDQNGKTTFLEWTVGEWVYVNGRYINRPEHRVNRNGELEYIGN